MESSARAVMGAAALGAMSVPNIQAHGKVQRMGWLRKSLRGCFDPDAELVERLTTVRRFPPRTARETVPLSARATVQGWIRSLRPEDDAQVHVRRHWGVLAVVADGRNPITVVVSDNSHTWVARPNGPGRIELTTDQIEHLTLEALEAEKRPDGDTWEPLT